MSFRCSRRSLLKVLGLATVSPLISKMALAAEDEWVLGFGSCMDLRRKQSFWNALNARSFNHFAFLGDNLYPERDLYSELTKSYEELSRCEGLSALRARVPVSAIWDDHDFGADNADSRLPFRTASLNLFKNFWKQELASDNDGVYLSRIFQHAGRKIHLIMLDARYNRTPYAPEVMPLEPDIAREELAAEKPTLLGAAQWAWLESELQVPADLKIIASGIQILSYEHKFEKWMNYPHERERLLQLLGQSSVPSVLLSGDRHLHEITRLKLDTGRTLYDFTSSGLNKADGLSRFEQNSLRVHRHLDDGFGEVRVKWNNGRPAVTLIMLDDRGNERFSHSDELS
ncbi:MAG: hypothetical protein RIR26_1028 [Pseudomonadota bacterium]